MSGERRASALIKNCKICAEYSTGPVSVADLFRRAADLAKLEST